MAQGESVETIARRVRQMRLRNYDRDQRLTNVKEVRAGNIDKVAPGLLPDMWPRPIVANTINVAAQMMAEQIGVMPTVSCTAGIQVSDLQKKYAQKRTLIAHNYVERSRLKVKTVSGGDWLNTYAFLACIVEPHFCNPYCDPDCEPGPRIRFEHSLGAYYQLDMYGRTRYYAKVHLMDVGSLVARFPMLQGKIFDDPDQEISSNAKVEVVQYYDHDQILTYMPSRANQVILTTPNKMGRCPVIIAELPQFDEELRGSYDDIVWVQIARAVFAQMGMRAAKKSINAPLVLPPDVPNIAFGPDRTIRTSMGEKVHYVAQEMSPAAWQLGEILGQELTVGARFPESQTGKSPGSVVTGRGMQELNSTIDSKVSSCQNQLAEMYQRAISMCFEMDEKFWPSKVRHIRVMVKGQQFEDTYKPNKDIKGVYQVDVTYGMMQGMDPNRGMVFLLQGLSAGLFSKDYVLRQLPVDVNVDQILEGRDVEDLNDGLKHLFLGLAAAAPQMAAQGQDLGELAHQFATVIQQREKGLPLYKAALETFAPKKPPPGQQPPGADQGQDQGQGPPGMPPGLPGMQAPGGGPPGAGGPPGPPGAGPPGGAPPGGKPDIMTLLAGLSRGGANPQMGANVKGSLGG